MRVTAFVVFLLLVPAPILDAQEQAPSDAEIIGLDTKVEGDRKLLAFCQGALLHQRGLACSPLAGTTDMWILERLVPKREFLAALDAAPASSLLRFEGADPGRARKDGSDDLLRHYQRQDKYTDKLKSVLTPEQRKRLPLVYLYTEGLIALYRPEFMGVLDGKESQERIQKMANEAWSKEASPIHRALFGLQSLDEAPLLAVDLRRSAYHLDLRIANALSKSERAKLVELLSSTTALRRETHGAPAY